MMPEARPEAVQRTHLRLLIKIPSYEKDETNVNLKGRSTLREFPSSNETIIPLTVNYSN